MRRTTHGVLALALIVGVLAPATSLAADSWWDNFSNPKTVTLAKILADPYAFKAVPVRFTIQFHETTKFYNPFFTRFTPETHVCFAAWGDEAALWMPEDFAASHPLFFVDKSKPEAETILSMAPFTRMTVTGIVSSTFKGEAWIHIIDIDVESKSLSRGALGNIITGDKFAQEDRYNAAIQHYLQAYNAKDLPPPARAVVAARLGRAYMEVHKPVQAQQFLGEAIKLNPDDEASKQLMNQVIGKIAGAPDVAPEPRLGPGEKPAPEPDGETFDTPEPGPTPKDQPEVEPGKEPAPDEVDPDKDNPDKRLSPPR